MTCAFYLEVSSDDHDLVVLSDWQRSDVMLCAKVLGQRGGHNLRTRYEIASIRHPIENSTTRVLDRLHRREPVGFS